MLTAEKQLFVSCCFFTLIIAIAGAIFSVYLLSEAYSGRREKNVGIYLKAVEFWT